MCLRNAIRNSCIPNLSLCPYQALCHCWKRYKEGASNLSSREAAQRMQCEGDLGFQRQSRMTASEHELEPFVGNRSLFHVLFSSLLLMLKQHLQHNLFACKRVFTAQAINGLVPGCSSYPRARIMGNAIDRPALKGHEQRILQGILGQLEISHSTNQSSENAVCFT